MAKGIFPAVGVAAALANNAYTPAHAPVNSCAENYYPSGRCNQRIDTDALNGLLSLLVATIDDAGLGYDCTDPKQLSKAIKALAVPLTRPMFYAVAAGNTTLTASTYTKVALTNALKDTTGGYSSAASTFTPTQAGWYLMGAGGTFASAADGPTTDVRIYVNGLVAANGVNAYTIYGSQASTVDNGSASCACGVTYFNGTSDYAELYAYKGTTSSANYICSNARMFAYYLGA